MTYTIVKRDSMEDLISAVQEAIRAGWRPLGGVFVDRKAWLQTMTRS
jgi:hypothetical protein